jgi:Peptidase family M48
VIAAMALPPAVSVLLGVFAPRLGRRLPPETSVRLLTGAMLVTALATGFVLAVAAVLVLGQIPVVGTAGHWSTRVLGSGLPVPVAAGCLAALLVCALLATALRRAALGGRDLVLAALTCRRLGSEVAGGLVVIDDEVPDAYALPGGLGGRIVVSTAMLRALPADERRVLLAHESAHLTRRHHLWVQAAEVAAAANPLLRPAARVVRAAVERDADEVAAAEVGDRALAARALARAGLARATSRREAQPAVMPAAALAGADGTVADRARALLAGPPQRRRALAGALAALMLATVTAAAVTSVQTEDRFEAAEHAYLAR